MNTENEYAMEGITHEEINPINEDIIIRNIELEEAATDQDNSHIAESEELIQIQSHTHQNNLQNLKNILQQHQQNDTNYSDITKLTSIQSNFAAPCPLLICSVNIQGLRTLAMASRKMNQVFDSFSEHHHIIMLQESDTTQHIYNKALTSHHLRDWLLIGSHDSRSKILLNTHSSSFQFIQHNSFHHHFRLNEEWKRRVTDVTIRTSNSSIIHIINLYSPVNPTENNEFFTSFLELLSIYKQEHLLDTFIIGGDFNNVTSATDQQNHDTFRNTIASRAIVESFNHITHMVDGLIVSANYHQLNDNIFTNDPNSTNYNQSPLNDDHLFVLRQKRRLDRFYISQEIADRCSIKFKTSDKRFKGSSHHSIHIKIIPPNSQQRVKNIHNRFYVEDFLFSDASAVWYQMIDWDFLLDNTITSDPLHYWDTIIAKSTNRIKHITTIAHQWYNITKDDTIDDLRLRQRLNDHPIHYCNWSQLKKIFQIEQSQSNFNTLEIDVPSDPQNGTAHTTMDRVPSDTGETNIQNDISNIEGLPYNHEIEDDTSMSESSQIQMDSAESEEFQVDSDESYFTDEERDTNHNDTTDNLLESNQDTTNVERPNTKIITDNTDILQQAAQFYRKLYSAQPNNPDEINNYLSNVPLTISNQERSLLERPLTLSEFDKVMKKYKLERSTPGEDGFTYKFVYANWKKIGPILVLVGEEISRTRKLPESMKQVIIRLIPKKKRSNRLENLRPISLTSVFIRIISAAYNNRLLPILSRLIHTSQIGFIEGRTMETANYQYSRLIEIIKDRNNYWNKEPTTLAGNIKEPVRYSMLSLDMHKAFDKLDHNYIEALLQSLKFPPSFINFVMAVTSQQIGAILNGGEMSEKFDLASGVRQGNPISPSIFVLCIEPFLFKMRRKMDGVVLKQHCMGENIIKTLAFADDISLFLGGKHDSELFKREFSDFSRVSGLELNHSKSHLIYLKNEHFINQGIRPQVKAQYEEHFDDILDIKGEYLTNLNPKILGFPLSKGTDWEELGDQLVRRIRYPLIDDLPTTIKALSLSVYSLSRIYFRDPMFTIPSKQLHKVQETLSQKFPQISITTLMMPKKLGGFGLMDLEKQLDGHRAKMMYYLFSDKSYNWAYMDLKDRLQYWALHICESLNIHPSSRFYEQYSGPDGDTLIEHFHDTGHPPQQQQSGHYNILEHMNIDSITEKLYKGFHWSNFLDGSLLKFFNQLAEDSHIFKYFDYKPTKFSAPHPNSGYSITAKELYIKLLPSFKRKYKTAKQSAQHLSNHQDLSIHRFLTKREIKWFEAWHKVVHWDEDRPDQLNFFIARTGKEIYDQYIDHENDTIAAQNLDKLRDIQDEKITLESFKHYNKKYYEEKVMAKPREYKDIAIGKIERISKQKVQEDRRELVLQECWGKVWAMLNAYQLMRKQPGLLESLQRFNLGLYQHRFQDTYILEPIEGKPYAHIPRCCLCDKDKETYDHYFEECEVSKRLWETYCDTRSDNIMDQIFFPFKEPMELCIQYNNYIALLIQLRKWRRYGEEMPRFEWNHIYETAENIMRKLQSSRSYFYWGY